MVSISWSNFHSLFKILPLIRHQSLKSIQPVDGPAGCLTDIAGTWSSLISQHPVSCFCTLLTLPRSTFHPTVYTLCCPLPSHSFANASVSAPRKTITLLMGKSLPAHRSFSSFWHLSHHGRHLCRLLLSCLIFLFLSGSRWILMWEVIANV